MRRVRHRIVVAIGLLVLTGGAITAAQAQSAKRAPQANAQTERTARAHAARHDPRQAQQYRLERINGRLYRVPVRESGLPGFRLPQSWNERTAPSAPRTAAAPAAPRTAATAAAPRTAAAPSAPRTAAAPSAPRTAAAPSAPRTAAAPTAPRTAAPPPQQAARQVAHARTSQQAVRTQQPSRTAQRANAAGAEPSGLSKHRPSALVAEARRYLGTNPTKMARRWCARFMNFVLDRVGMPGTGSDAAKSFALYGKRISGPQYGAIAVLTRKGGGHVGIVTGVDRHGNPILIAGNNGRRQVGISVYPKRRVIAYVMPDGRAPAKPARVASAKPTRVASAAKSSKTGTR